MDMTAIAQRYVNQSEYLEKERLAEYKSEYFNGEIFAMAGARYNHNRITQNLSVEIGVFLKGKACNTFSSDMRLHIPANSLYTYPDFMIVCGNNQFLDKTKDTILNPSIIIEVLSDSTEAYDRGEKFHLYRSIESLSEYVLINSLKVAIEVFRKNEDGIWMLSSEAYHSADEVEMNTIQMKLPVQNIYLNTEDIAI
jgi:Uma2 family endonuclease